MGKDRLQNLKNKYQNLEVQALKFRKEGNYINYLKCLRQARKLRIEHTEIANLLQIKKAKSLVLN